MTREDYAKYVDYCLVKRVTPMRFKQWREHVERCVDHLEFIASRYRMNKPRVVEMIKERENEA